MMRCQGILSSKGIWILVGPQSWKEQLAVHCILRWECWWNVWAFCMWGGCCAQVLCWWWMCCVWLHVTFCSSRSLLLHGWMLYRLMRLLSPHLEWDPWGCYRLIYMRLLSPHRSIIWNAWASYWFHRLAIRQHHGGTAHKHVVNCSTRLQLMITHWKWWMWFPTTCERTWCNPLGFAVKTK